MRNLFFLCSFFLCHFSFSRNIQGDSAFGKKFKKNIIDIGFNLVTVFDHNGLNPSNINLGYTRFFKHQYFVKVEGYSYEARNENNANKNKSDLKKGDVIDFGFKTIRLGLGKTFLLKRIHLSPYMNVNYRWQNAYGQLLFWESAAWSTENSYVSQHINSFGVGSGLNVAYLLFHNLMISLEGNYAYNFEKKDLTSYGGVPTQDALDAFNFEPNRKYATIQIKLGFKF